MRKAWFGAVGLVLGVPVQASAQVPTLPLPGWLVEYALIGLIGAAATLVLAQVTYQAFHLYRDSRRVPLPALVARERLRERRDDVPIDAFELPLNDPEIIERREPATMPVSEPPSGWLGEADRAVNQW